MIDAMPTWTRPDGQANEAEVVAAVFVSPGCMADLADVVVADDFGYTPHRELWAAFESLDADGQPIDEVTVRAELVRRNQWERIGGMQMLARLMDRAGTSANVRHYAGLVHDEGVRRRYRDGGAALEGLSLNPDVDLDQLHAAAEDVALSADGGRDAGCLTPSLDVVRRVMTPGRSVPMLPTGIGPLDEALVGGLPKGEPTLIGGRPSMGKSALMGDIVNHGLSAGYRMAVFSPEHAKETFIERLLAKRARISVHEVRARIRKDAPTSELIHAADVVSSAALWIDDSADVTAAQIKRRCKVLARQAGGLDLVAVDYWQTMSHPRRGNEPARDSERRSSQALRVMARELGCALIEVTQLRKSAEDKHRPTAADVRECDALVEHAARILAPFRPSVADPDRDESDAEILVLKGREVALGAVRNVRWEGLTMSFLGGRQ